MTNTAADGVLRTMAAKDCGSGSCASIFRLAACLFWTAALLIGLELCLEYRAWHRGYSSLLFGVPGVGGTSVAEGVDFPAAEFCPTGDFPFRSRVPANDRAGEIRIWIASASHAEDIYQPVDRIFPSLLEARLRESGVKCLVINGSRAGDTVQANLRTLREFAPRLKPDFIVLYQMGMDISRLSKRRAAIESSQPAAQQDLQQEQAGASVPPPKASWATQFVESTTLYELLKSNVSARISRRRMLPDDLAPDDKCEFLENVSQFVQTAHALGARPLLCTFALSHDASNLNDMPQGYTVGTLRHTPTLSIIGWIQAAGDMNRRLRVLGEQLDCPVVELEARLRNRPELFRDFVHFSLPGHQVVASEIATSLLDQIRQREGAPAP